MSLEGRVVLVTGGSRGIGLAIARELVRAGASVMISSRKQTGLEGAAAELRATASGSRVEWFVAHAGHPDEAAACVEVTLKRLGRLDVLVNNAGTSPYLGPLMTMPLPLVQKIYEVNQLGPLAFAQSAWNVWMANHGGVIVNVASIGGMQVEKGFAWYNVTKAALIHLTRHLAAEMAPGVRVNAICPGFIRTDMTSSIQGKYEARLADLTPLRRIGEAVDVARLALFLASDQSSWVTGQTFVIDGGALVAPSVFSTTAVE